MIMDSKTTQRLVNPNWRPSNVAAQAVCKAFYVVTASAPATVRQSDADSTVVTVRIPVIGTL